VAAGGFPPLFISVWGGKEPLLSWLSGLCQGLLGMVDPVVAGRLPALLGGAVALAALVVVGRWLFSPAVAYLGGLLYLLWPFALLFNVQLQADSLMVGEAALMAVAALSIRRGGGWLPVVGLTLAFAAAMLTKSSALLYLLALPGLLLARPATAGANLRRPAVRLAIAVLAGYLIYYAVFGRTRYAADVAQYNSIYVLPISELLFLPLDRWLANVRFLAENALGLLGVLPALLAATALAWAWSRGGPARGLAIWIMVPLGLHLLVGTGLFARYFAPALPWLALLSAAALAAGFHHLRARWPRERTGSPRVRVAGLAAGMILLLAQPASTSLRLLADPVWTIERGYTHDFGAVLAELRQELRRQATQGPVVLLIYRGQGPLEDGSWVFLDREPGLRLLYLAPGVDGRLISGPGVPPSADLVAYDPTTGEGVPARLLPRERVYFVGGDGRNPPPGTVGHVEPVVTFTGLAGTHPLTLFRPTWDAAYWDGAGLVVQ